MYHSLCTYIPASTSSQSVWQWWCKAFRQHSGGWLPRADSGTENISQAAIVTLSVLFFFLPDGPSCKGAHALGEVTCQKQRQLKNKKRGFFSFFFRKRQTMGYDVLQQGCLTLGRWDGSSAALLWTSPDCSLVPWAQKLVGLRIHIWEHSEPLGYGLTTRNPWITNCISVNSPYRLNTWGIPSNLCREMHDPRHEYGSQPDKNWRFVIRVVKTAISSSAFKSLFWRR